MSKLSVDDIILELRSRFETADGRTEITEDDIRRWSVETVADRLALFDQIALRLAGLFYGREASFGFCDTMVNKMVGHLYFGFLTDGGPGWPEIFWQTYEAFDAGEYFRAGRPEEDPVEVYTRPMIRRIVERYGRPASASAGC